MKKELEQSKNDSYYIKKSFKSHRKEIRIIKKDSYINKITFVKIEKHINFYDIEKEIEIITKKTSNINNKLQLSNKYLNIFRKRERGNRDNINKTGAIIQDIKKGLHNTKKEYNLAINACKTINKKICGNKKELQKPIVKIVDVNKNYDQIIMLQRDYVLSTRDMEMILRKFVYERFLTSKLRG